MKIIDNIERDNEVRSKKRLSLKEIRVFSSCEEDCNFIIGKNEKI